MRVSIMDLLTIVLLVLSFVSTSISQSVIQIYPEHRRNVPGGRRFGKDDASNLFFDSWRLSVETNNAGPWVQIPEKYLGFVKEYMTGDRYLSDSDIVADDSLQFANTVKLTGKDAWVFDIDETLLSNLPYYDAHGFGSEIFDEKSFDDWVDQANAPALPASLKLYNELQKLGFTIFLLTGRSEYQRNVTHQNLLFSGYSNWKKLFLRGPSDYGTLATVYKSKKRKEIEDEGYTIQGCSGDQWSDLWGYSVAQRSFKIPNPMYYIA